MVFEQVLGDSTRTSNGSNGDVWKGSANSNARMSMRTHHTVSFSFNARANLAV
jgi:hypothetical protein